MVTVVAAGGSPGKRPFFVSGHVRGAQGAAAGIWVGEQVGRTGDRMNEALVCHGSRVYYNQVVHGQPFKYCRGKHLAIFLSLI